MTWISKSWRRPGFSTRLMRTILGLRGEEQGQSSHYHPCLLTTHPLPRIDVWKRLDTIRYSSLSLGSCLRRSTSLQATPQHCSLQRGLQFNLRLRLPQPSGEERESTMERRSSSTGLQHRSQEKEHHFLTMGGPLLGSPRRSTPHAPPRRSCTMCQRPACAFRISLERCERRSSSRPGIRRSPATSAGQGHGCSPPPQRIAYLAFHHVIFPAPPIFIVECLAVPLPCQRFNKEIVVSIISLSDRRVNHIAKRSSHQSYR